MSTLSAVIFDVDGTLADTERDGHRVAFNMAFKKAGLDWDWSVEQYQDLLSVTGGKERMQEYMQQIHSPLLQSDQRVQMIQQLHADKNQYYADILAQSRISLRPGINRLINECHNKGITMAIATTTTMSNVDALLNNTLDLDYKECFDLIAAGDIVAAKKPAGDIYQYVIDHLNLNVDECVALEDSANGLMASKSVGLCTLITLNGYTRDHDFSAADMVVDQLGEPNMPCKVLHGIKPVQDYVDVSCLESLLEQANR